MASTERKYVLIRFTAHSSLHRDLPSGHSPVAQHTETLFPRDRTRVGGPGRLQRDARRLLGV